MKKMTFLISSILVLALSLGSSGCAQLSESLGSVPKAEIIGLGVGSFDLEGATINLEIGIDNPSAIPIPLVDLAYRFRSGEQPLVEGKAALDGSIPARGYRSVSVPVSFKYRDILNTAKDLRLGQVVPYEAELFLLLNLPTSVQPTPIPLKKSGQFPIPNIPKIQMKGFEWNRLDAMQAEGVLRLDIVNTNEFIVQLLRMDYDLELAGARVASSRLAKSLELEPSGGKGSLEIPVSVSPAKVGLGVFKTIVSGDMDYDLKGSINLATPFGPINMPLNTTAE